MPDDPQKQIRLVRVLWICFLSTIGVFTAIPFLVVQNPVGVDPLSRNPVLIVLQILGICVALASFVLRRTLLKPGTSMEAPEDRAKWLRCHILSFSLNEAVALLGVICALTAQSPKVGLSFSAMALLLHLQMFPKPRS